MDTGRTPDPLLDILGELADPSALERESHQRVLMRALRAADVFVVLQPVAYLRRPGVVGYEALVRLRGEGGITGGERALAMSRNAGLVHILDRMAWRSAILQARPMLARGAYLFLNFAPDSLYNPIGAFQELAREVGTAGGRPDRLVVEVIRAASMEAEDLLRIREACRSAGLRLSLDDWPVTAPAEVMFSQVTPDFVKLDPGHFRSARWDRALRLRVEEVVREAHRHGVWVVAKGVEQPEDLALALQVGVDMAQGYYLGRPCERPTNLSSESRDLLQRAVGG